MDEKTTSLETTSFLNRNKYLIVVLLVFMFVLTIQNPIDPDTYWHLKVGQYVLQYGMPQKDMFSYWDTGFIAQEWLFDVFVCIVYSIFGYVGLVISRNIFVFATLLIAGNIQKDKRYWFAYLLPFAFCIRTMETLLIRPQVVSVLLIVIALYILQNDKNKFVLPILTLLCANIHGGLCIVIFFIYILFVLIRLFEGETINWKETILVFVLMVAASVITPYGYKNVLFGLKMPAIATENVSEYKPFVSKNSDIPFLILALAPLACMAYTKNAKLIDIVMMSMGICFLLRWIRFSIFYVPICLGFGCQYIQETIYDVWNRCTSKLKFKDNLKLKFSKFKFKFKTEYLYIVSSIMLVIAIGFSLTEIVPFNENESKFAPKIIVDYIEENDIDVENNVMFNEYNFGGYLIFNNIPVFIDGRCEPYLEAYDNIDVFPDYLTLAKGENEGAILYLINKYNIKYFALYKDRKLEKLLTEKEYATSLVKDDMYELLAVNEENVKIEIYYNEEE